MDGRGRWMDNVFIERLWKSVNMKRYISRLTTQLPRPGRNLQSTLIDTIKGGAIRGLTT